jgi:cytochrome c
VPAIALLFNNLFDLRSKPKMMTFIPGISKFAVITLALTGLVSSSVFAFDAETAEEIARQNSCFKCHAIEKKKDGPAYRDVAAKYRGKADAEERLIKHLTTGPTIKGRNGEEEHRIIKTKDEEELKNVVQWILSL